MLVVTMTSWPKRIHNVIKVCDSIFRNTVQPDRVYLNLSLEEFPNKTKDLPLDLTLFNNVNQKLYINWVDGPNTRTFKKIVPILQYLNSDDLIISADDDFTFPRDLIESRLTDFKIYNCQHPVTPNRYNYVNKSAAKLNFYMSPTSIFTKQMLACWETWYTPELIELNEDDRVNTYIMYSNGYSFKYSTKHTIHELISRSFNISNNDQVASTKVAKRDTPRTERLLNEKLITIKFNSENSTKT